jgi:hypothetical protein
MSTKQTELHWKSFIGHFLDDTDFFSDLIEQDDENEDLPSLYEYGLSGTSPYSTPNNEPNPSLQGKTNQGCASVHFSGQTKVYYPGSTDQEQNQRIPKTNSNAFHPRAYGILDEPIPKRKSIADISNNWNTVTQTRTVSRPQLLSLKIPGWDDFKAAKNQFNNKESTTISEGGGKRKESQEISAANKGLMGLTGAAITKRKTDTSLSSRIPGWDDFKAAKNQFNNKESITIPEEGGHEQPKRNKKPELEISAVKKGFIRVEDTSLSSRIPGWSEAIKYQYKDKVTLDPNLMEDQGPDNSNKAAGLGVADDK